MIYKFEWIENNAHVTFDGVVNFDDINKTDEKIFGDLRFELMKYAIFDFRTIENFKVSEEEAQVMGVLDRTSSIWHRNIRIALVSTNIELIEASKVYKANLKGSKWTVKIFSNYKDALKWCNS